jgi:hypothetical protein
MARGWESKSIEQQIEDARMSPNQDPTLSSPPDQVQLQQKREGLQLQRSRVLQEMETARNPRYREMLGEMLRHLDSQLESL